MICFAWEGFPQYAARCVGALVRSINERVVVLATRPGVPVKGMEELSNCEVHWVKAKTVIDLRQELGEIPRCLFSSAWWAPEFCNSWSIVRKNGGLVFGMIDNNYLPTIKCFLNGIRFRVCYAHRFDGFLVPGNSGVRLLRSYGVEDKKIAKGMYCADSSLFCSSIPLSKRHKSILYTGRLIGLKNVIRMSNAFLKANQEVGEEWKLEICGDGPLRNQLPRDSSIVTHGFVQPEFLAGLYQKMRCLVLPSFWDHWGMVVHEAALSGCMLLLSNRVGAADDFLSPNNGALFNPSDESEMVKAFCKVMTMTDEEMDNAGRISLQLAKSSDQNLFVQSVCKLAGIKEFRREAGY